MFYSAKTYTIQALAKKINQGQIILNHKLQRREGQWSRQVRSELIDSIVKGYPIPAPYGVRNEEKNIEIIDGIQRLSTIRDYVNNVFALSDNMGVVECTDSNGSYEINIGSMKFEELPEDIKDIILNAQIQMFEITEYTQEEVKVIFRRLNAGKPLSSQNKRTSFESDDFGNLLFELTSHEVFKNMLTSAQLRADLDKEAIRQSFMILSDWEFKSLKASEIDKFVSEFGQNIDYELVDLVRQSLDELLNVFDKKVALKKLLIPLVIYGEALTIKLGKSTDAYAEWLMDFIKNYPRKIEFLKYCGSGTASAEKSLGRINYFKDAIENF